MTQILYFLEKPEKHCASISSKEKHVQLWHWRTEYYPYCSLSPQSNGRYWI